MQNISNIVDLLLASVNGIQISQPTPAVQDPNSNGIDFFQILGGLTGSDEEGMESNPLSPLSESTLNHAKDLLAGNDSQNGTIDFAKARDVLNLLTGKDRHPNYFGAFESLPAQNDLQNELADPVDTRDSVELLAGQGRHPIIFSPFIKLENSTESAPVKSAENLILQPGEYDEVNIGRLIDSPFAHDRGSNLSDQGGHSVFSDMLNVADLEQLKAGESVTIKLANAEIPDMIKNLPVTLVKSGQQEIAEITFTKMPDSGIEANPDNSRFEVTVKSGYSTAQLEAVLIDDKRGPQIKDLQGLIVEHQAKDAKLILYVTSDKNPTEPVQMSGQKIEQPASQTNFNQFMNEDSTAKLRQFNLQRGLLPQNDKPDAMPSSDSAEIKTAVRPKQESNFGQTNNETRQNLCTTILPRTDMHTGSSPDFAEKLSSSLQLDVQTSDGKAIELETNDKARAQLLSRDIQFKIEQPLNKADIPNSGSFRIKITPEALGKIDVQLDIAHDKMVARLIVESPQAKQAVEANLNSLKETLHQSGIKVENITINIAGQNGAANFSNRQAGQFANNNFRNSNYDFEAEDIEVIPEISGPRNSMNLQGSLSIFA